MNGLKEKVGGWAASGIVGNVAWLALVAVFGFLSGSFADVAAFVVSHPLAALVWSLLFLSVGVVIGMAIRGRKASRAAASTGSAARSSEDPLAVLTPKEIAFLLRVYDESSVHVGGENFAMAKKLNDKGLVFRVGCPGEVGQVIQQCDVVLADDLVPMMNARIDELRKEAY